ncbi:MAG TPA: hypothetical protein VNY08_19010 [Bradyrhizobium sp.]|jgi:hypothetical protein|nr:hypothetical protein [Bradyrhizobium sp.]
MKKQARRRVAHSKGSIDLTLRLVSHCGGNGPVEDPGGWKNWIYVDGYPPLSVKAAVWPGRADQVIEQVRMPLIT